MPGTLSNLLVLPPLTIAIVATDFIGDRGTLVLVPTTGGVLFALERTLRSGV